jgi:hypothetical protein
MPSTTDRKAIYTDKLLRREIYLKAKTESGLELTDDDVTMCIMTMERKRVSYFHDHIWANQRWDKNMGATRIVWTLTADGRRSIAHSHGLVGMDQIQFEENEDGTPKLARVRVYRQNAKDHAVRDGYHGEARFVEYVEKQRDGKIQQNWLRRPFAQLGKCAEMQALRRAFPEMDIEDDIPEDVVESVWSGEGVPEETFKEMEEERARTKEESEGLAESAVRPAPKLVEPEITPEHEARAREILEAKSEKEAIEKAAAEAAAEAEGSAKLLEDLKAEAVIHFKAWADRFNDGKAIPWKTVYAKLTGIELKEDAVMDANDYGILIAAFKDALKEE